MRTDRRTDQWYVDGVEHVDKLMFAGVTSSYQLQNHMQTSITIHVSSVHIRTYTHNIVNQIIIGYCGDQTEDA